MIFAPVFTRDRIEMFEGMKVVSGVAFDFGEDMVKSHWDNHKPTFLLTCGDWFQLRTIPELAAQDQLLWVAWSPYDWLRIPDPVVQNTLRFAWKVVPWLQWDKQHFLQHGLNNVTEPIPLGVDTKLWVPKPRSELPRVMASVGFREDTYNILCFPPGVPVFDEAGTPKAIEDVVIGEHVLARDSGALVEKTFKRDYNGLLTVLKPLGLPALRVTPAHPILAVRREEVRCWKSGHASFNCTTCRRDDQDAWEPEWVPAGELSEGDYVVSPIPEDVEERRELDIQSLIDIPCKLYPDGSLGSPPSAKRLPATVSLTPGFLRLVGYYLAEGSIMKNHLKDGSKSPSAVSFSFHSKETAYAEDIQETCRALWGLDAPIYYDKARPTSMKVIISNAIIARLFQVLGSEYAHTKRIHPILMRLAPEQQDHLIEGLYRGGGSLFRSTNRSSYRRVLGIVSEGLAWQAMTLLLRIGHIPSLIRSVEHTQDPSGKERTITVYRVQYGPEPAKRVTKAFRRGHHVVRPLIWTKQEEYNGPVYNLETSPSHTYVAGGIVSHNCLGANQRRKYWYEQLEGINVFRKAHPEVPVRIYFHTWAATQGEHDMRQLAQEAHVDDIIQWADQYGMSQGGLSESQLAAIMNCADVVMNACLEGFGFAMVQAQAVGVPVIFLEEGGASEIVQFGASVPTMGADYTAPLIKPIPHPVGVGGALEQLLPYRNRRDEHAIDFTRRNFDWDVVAAKWIELIDHTLMPERERYSLYVPEPSERLRQSAAEIVEVVP